MNLSLILKSINHLDIIGNKKINIKSFIDINFKNTSHNNVMWLSKKNLNDITKIKSGVIICPVFKDVEKLYQKKKVTFIQCENPRREFSRAQKYFFSNSKKNLRIKKNKLRLKTGKNVIIEKNVKIGKNVTIGHNSVIRENTIIGNNVIIGCSCTIGGIGFGYTKNEKGNYEQIFHSGNVILKDDVEIGNSTNIEKASIGSTIIGKNCKIGHLVSIGHSCKISENCIITTFANISGSCEIGKNVWIGPKANLHQKMKVGDNSVVGMSSVVIKSVPSNSTVFGFPAKVISK